MALTGKGAQEQRVACDQCHRRKVKCDEGLPCEKCKSANLQCTRQLVRKRRGPKKGSGSVIAQLRSSHSQGLDPNGSPLASPMALDGSGFVPTYANPLMEDGLISSPTATNFSGSPTITFSGLIPSSQPWTYGGPPQSRHDSGDQFLSVNELAQRLLRDEDFFNSRSPTSHPVTGQNGSHIPSPSPLDRNYPPPTSIESLLAPTPTSHAQSFPSSYQPTPNSGSFPPSFTSQPIFPHAMSFPDDEYVNLAVSTGMSANDGAIMSKCVDLYFQHLYPIMPVIHEPTFRRLLVTPTSLMPDDKALILALCAVTILHVVPPTNLSWNVRKDLAQRFLQQFLQTRLTYDFTENSSVSTIISSYFVHVTCFEIKKLHSSWFYLREAVGMAYELGLDSDDKYQSMNNIEQVACRRTFALLFLTERGASILRNKPIVISKLRELPAGYFENEEPSILAGFQYLCQLFSLLDEKFIEYWNAPQESGLQPRASVDIAAVQNQLNGLELEIEGLDDVQKADVLITHQWLRLVFWQAAMRQGLLSSNADDAAFTYRFPIDIARSLCSVLSRVPIEAVLVHGIGIVRDPIFHLVLNADRLAVRKGLRSRLLPNGHPQPLQIIPLVQPRRSQISLPVPVRVTDFA
jgi:hypothetical protein